MKINCLKALVVLTLLNRVDACDSSFHKDQTQEFEAQSVVSRNDSGAQAFSSYLKIHDFFFTATSAHVMDITPVAKAYLREIDLCFLNPVMVQTSDRLPLNEIDAIIHSMEQATKPWSISLPQSEQIHNFLIKKGLIVFDSGELMQKDLKGLCAADKGSLTIRKVHDLSDWGLCGKEGFDSTDTIISQYTLAHERALKTGADLQHYVGYYGDEAVAALTLTVHGSLAYLSDVATRPSYQRRGFGVEMMHFVLGQAAMQGASLCYLESSPAGNAMYRRLGFQPILKFDHYALEKWRS